MRCGRKINGDDIMDAQLEILNSLNKKYDGIKEKVADINKRFLELTNQHTTLNESFYVVKKDLNLLHNEMDSIRRLRDRIKRELGIVD
jgi:archaellum component FlaC